MNNYIAQTNLILAEAIFSKIKLFSTTPSAIFSEFFKKYPQCGRRDRQIIVGVICSILRNWESFHWMALYDIDSLALNRKLILLGALSIQSELSEMIVFGKYIRSLSLSISEQKSKLSRLINFLVLSGVSEKESFWLFNSVERFLFGLRNGSLPQNAFFDLPDWIIRELSGFAKEFLQKLTLSLASPASIDLRINTLKSSKAEIIKFLNDQCVVFSSCKYAPNGVRLGKKIGLSSVISNAAGRFEIQDEGSQLISHLVAPSRREIILDFCAGSGGKTMALAAMMKNKGKIFAIDNSSKRLAKLGPRIERAGIKNVYSILISSESDLKLQRFIGKADKVLVDAPCSGIGTLRRNPHLKNWYNPHSLQELNAKQLALISSASNFVKKGGRLVYATCSFLPSENENVLEYFLKKNRNFVLDDAPAILCKQNIALPFLEDFDGAGKKPILEKCLRLFPSIHNTDGFFAASVTRVA